MAADCGYVSSAGTQEDARTRILTDVNSVNSLYQEAFNVSVGVVILNVQDATCPSTVNSSVPWNVGCGESSDSLSLNDRLSIFSQWRGDIEGPDGAGLWTLMTNCSTDSGPFRSNP